MRHDDQRHGKGFFGFLAGTFLFSWLCWLPGLLVTCFHSVPSRPLTQAISVLSWLGGVGPTIVALGFIYAQDRKSGLKKSVSRLWAVRLGAWYLPTLLLLPFSLVSAHLLNRVMNGVPFPQTGMLSEPWWIPVVFLIFMTLSISEEIGWRGFALDQLQVRFGALTSSLIIGSAWALWHLPMFLSKGFGHHDKHLPFSQFFITLVLASIIITWLQNSTRQSLIPALAVHGFINLSGEVLPLLRTNDQLQTDFRAWMFLNLILLVITLFLISRYGAEHLSKDVSPSRLTPDDEATKTK